VVNSAGCWLDYADSMVFVEMTGFALDQYTKEKGRPMGALMINLVPLN